MIKQFPYMIKQFPFNARPLYSAGGFLQHHLRLPSPTKNGLCHRRQSPFRVSKKPPTGKMQRMERRARKMTFRMSLGRNICFLTDVLQKNLLRKAFCLTAQHAPLEYPHTLRGRVACLGGSFDLCQSVKKQVFRQTERTLPQKAESVIISVSAYTHRNFYNHRSFKNTPLSASNGYGNHHITCTVRCDLSVNYGCNSSVGCFPC